VKQRVEVKDILLGQRRAVAKAITLIESINVDDMKDAEILLEQILPLSGKSVRVGITGVPGVGKSTFIEAYGNLLISKGHKVAVLAVDPSSPVTGGSILGDKTRMEKLSQAENAFIRPTPSSGFLGGVAQKTRESILLLEAAGFDYILVETVGVGQSEIEVANMVDFFLVLMLPNAGDELQGIKKGILELSDLMVINKADGDYINKAMQSMAQYRSAIDLFRHKEFWKTDVMTCSAINNENIDTIYYKIAEYIKLSKDCGHFEKVRMEQQLNWFKHLVNELLELRISSNKKLKTKKLELEAQIKSNKMLALTAARQFVDSFLTKSEK
jgi:LAO/AO transport system kinase